MTVKELLHNFVNDLSEEEAENALEALASAFGSSVRLVPISTDERESIERGLADLDAGRRIPHEEFVRRFGPDRWK